MARNRIPKDQNGGLIYDFYTEAAKESLPGHLTDDMYGAIDNITKFDGWVQCGPAGKTGYALPDWSGDDDVLDVVSTSANDAEYGTGAERVRMFGIAQEGKREVEQVDLNGTTPVTTNSPFTFLNFVGVRSDRIDNQNSSNIGTITISRNSDGGILSVIPPFTGRNADGRRIVQVGESLIPRKLTISTSTDAGLEVQLQKYRLDEVGNLDIWINIWGGFVTRGIASFDLEATGSYQGLSNVYRIMVRSTSPLPTSVRAHMSFIKVATECITPRVIGFGIDYPNAV